MVSFVWDKLNKRDGNAGMLFFMLNAKRFLYNLISLILSTAGQNPLESTMGKLFQAAAPYTPIALVNSFYVVPLMRDQGQYGNSPSPKPPCGMNSNDSLLHVGRTLAIRAFFLGCIYR